MESWKQHEGYEVSDLGNIRNPATGHLLKRVGNIQVKLHGRMRSVNRLVATLHLDPPPSPTSMLLHRDGDRNNCAAANLSWALRRFDRKQWVVFDEAD